MRLLAILLLLFSSLFASEILYVIHAKEATFDPRNEILALIDTDQSVTYFSHETPKRAGKTTVSSFLFNLLGKDRKFDAGFIYFEEDDAFYSDTPLELRDPHFDLETQNLTFKVRFENPKDHLPNKMVEVTLYVEIAQERD